MKKGQKNVRKIVEFSVLAFLVLVFLFCLLIELISPESAVAVWVKNNVWNIRNTLASMKSHLPVFIRCFIYTVITYAVSRLLRYFFKSQMNKNNRSKSVYTLLDGFVKYAAAIAIILFVLKALGVNTTALIASVGVLTLIVGLGAQPLIADVIAGMFIIFENEYNLGEIISIDGFRGEVIEIGIRSTKLLDTAGNIKIINHNNIGDVVNLSRELSLAVVECDFPYDVPLEKVEKILNKNIERIKTEVPDIVEGPYYKGVSQYKDSNVTIKIVAECKEENRFQVERDLLREYRMIILEEGIDISYPQVVVNYANGGEKSKASPQMKKEAKEFLDEQRKVSSKLDGESK